MQIIPILIAIAATGIWIAIERASRTQMRARLGADVTEIRIYRRWAQWAQRVLIALALLLPLVTVLIVSTVDSLDGSDIVMELIRSLWLLSAALGLGQSGRLLVGEHGIHLGRGEPIASKDIESIAWDRDIGQRQWGSTIVVTERAAKTKGLLRKQRLYVDRALKPEVEHLLRRHAAPALPAEA